VRSRASAIFAIWAMMVVVIAATLAAAYPPPTLAFELKRTRGFVPPPAVGKLADSVTLNLALGAHYFFTLVQHRQPTFGLVDDFLSFSTARNGVHVFHGSSFGDDTEFAGSYSQQFAKIVGVAFMAEYAESTWFAPLSRLWNDGLRAPRGRIALRKRHPTKDGPDHLAAPFDPTVTRTKDPLYVVEFKGRTGQVDFKHAAFVEWRKQARNIVASAGGREIKLKSWVLAFNYAFENLGTRNSTLLVEDPWTARADRPPLEATRGNIAFVVREHLARQCAKFDAGFLAAPVLEGRALEQPLTVMPRVYKVRHPALRNRRYVGYFAARGPNGELVCLPGPLTRMPSPLVVEVLGENPFRTAVVRVGSPRSPHHIFIEHDAPTNSPERTLRQIIRSILQGDEDTIFIGQDATMLRACMQTPVDAELGGEPFTEMIEFQGIANVDQEAGQGFVQVLRNGGLLADSSVVIEEENAEWWGEG